MRKKLLLASAQAVVLLFFVAFFIYPIAQVLQGGIVDASGNFTLFYLAEVFRNPLYLEGLRNATAIAICTTLLCLLISLPLGWLSDRFQFFGKRWLTAAVLLPLILPPFVGALGMQQVFGPYGAFNVLLFKLGLMDPAAPVNWLGSGGFWGIVLIEALHLYPIMFLNTSAAFSNVDPALHEAAADLGAVGWRRFLRVTLPLIMPGIFAGSTIVFIWSFTELGTPLMFNFGRVTSVQIFDGINEIGENPMPFALVIVLMAVVATLYLLAKLFFGRQAYAMTSKASRASQAQPLTPVRSLLATTLFLVLIGFSILPHLGVIGMAVGRSWYLRIFPENITFRHFDAALSNDLTVPSIMNSVHYASLASLIALILGVTIAYFVIRTRQRGRWLMDTLAMLPLAVPGLVLAFGYMAMTQEGRLFDFLNPVENPTLLLIVAYAVRRLPYVVRAAAAGLQQISVSFEEAAMDLGAPPWTAFRRITMPLIAANLIAGAILAFSFSMLEVSDSLILAQRAVHYPITKAIYELSMLLGQGQALAAALGVWTMVFLGASLLLSAFLLGKRMGALFRV